MSVFLQSAFLSNSLSKFDFMDLLEIAKLDHFMNFRAHLFLEELYFDRRGCVFLQSDGVPEESRNQARFRGLLSESVPSSG